MSGSEQNSNQEGIEEICIDPIKQEELNDALQTNKNRKAPGIDNLNIERFRYVG